MKRTFMGYSPKEVDKVISELNEHNDLLTKRLERQEEEIKELRARFAGFAAVESKLNAAVGTMSNSIAAMNDAAEAVESYEDVQQIFSSMSSLSAAFTEAADASRQAVKHEQDSLERAQRAVSKSCGKSRAVQDKLIDVAATSRVISCLLEPVAQRSSDPDVEKALTLVQAIHTYSMDAAKEDISFNIERALDHLNSVDISHIEDSTAKAHGDALKLQASANLIGENLAERAAYTDGIRAEASDLQKSLAAITNIASYAGKLSNEGLANIERSRVTTSLEQANGIPENETHVEISDPSDLIDNERPPVIPSSGDNSENETPSTQAAADALDLASDEN